MSSKYTARNYCKMSNTTSNVLNMRKGLIQHQTVDKDIAVENVIRQLRNKKNIEVKNVSKHIPLAHKKNSEGANPSKPSLADIGSKRILYINDQRTIEIEDDEIEDYLEIDQNVVEDLEALIPEEEIVSISNSLIQPDELLLESDNKSTLVETKTENNDISKENQETILINDTGEPNSLVQKASPDLGLNIEPKEEIEVTSSVDHNTKQATCQLIKTTLPNNNAGEVNNFPKASCANQNSEIQKYSRKNKKSLDNDNDQNLQIAKRTKQDSGQRKKITDYFTATSVKCEADSNKTQEISEVDLVDDQINSSISSSSSEVIEFDRKESENTVRILRSRSKINEDLHQKKLNVIPTVSKNNNKESVSVNIQNLNDVPPNDLEFVSCKSDDTEQVQNIQQPSKRDKKSKNYIQSTEESKKCLPEMIERDIPSHLIGKDVEIMEVQGDDEVIEASTDNIDHISSNKTVPSNEDELLGNKKKSQSLERTSKFEKNKKLIYGNTASELVNSFDDTENYGCKKEENGRKNAETSEVVNSMSKIGDKKRNKKRKSARNYENISEQNTISVQKNENSKLEIYNFDDKSVDGIEVLRKPSRKRPVSEELNVASSGRYSKYANVENRRKSKTQTEPPSANRDELNFNTISSAFDSQTYTNVMDKNNTNSEIKTADSDGLLNKLDPVDSEDTQEHNNYVYGPYKRVDRCNVCLMTFRSYKRLKTHRKIHEVENPYKCSKCEESFQDVEKLAAHLRIHKGFADNMDLMELSPEIDDLDYKPMELSTSQVNEYKLKKVPTLIDESARNNSESSPEKNMETTVEAKSEKSNVNKYNQPKNIKKQTANCKQPPRTRKRKTRNSLKSECKTESFDMCDDDLFLDSYAIPVEDQDEYSEIAGEESEMFDDFNDSAAITNVCQEPDDSFLIEYDNQIEDRDEYIETETHNTAELFHEDKEILRECPEDSDTVNEELILIEYENELEDQDEYSQISREGSERSVEDKDEKNGIGSEHEQSDFTDADLAMMNEMAKAEYLLEKDTKVTRKRRKKRKSIAEPKLLKVKRDNLPPLLLKSIRKKTLLLGKMPFSCKKCDATFWTSMQLDKHQLVHVLKKPTPPSKPPIKVFKCEECGKEFKKISDLERHIRVHTGEKPSVCNICNKRFQQPYNLNKHLYTHTQEKNFECVICQKKFGRNDVLNRHVLTHSIVKPFKCSICSKTFIRNTQLKLHLQKHHNLNEDPTAAASSSD